MPAELKGDALLDYYREALMACYGTEFAERASLRYIRGWYYAAPPKSARWPTSC